VAPDRFAAVIDRVRTSLRRGTEDVRGQLAKLVEAMAPRPRYLRRILVHQEDKAILLPVERIDRVEADRNYLKLHSGSSHYLVRSTVGALAERLDPAKFLQINRSEIVRLDAIKEMQPWFHGDYRVIMNDGKTLMWSRRYRAKREAEFR
jgi:two-component system LytT family response regulator